MAAGGQLFLDHVAPVQVVDAAHVSRDVARGRGGFLGRGVRVGGEGGRGGGEDD